MRWLWSKGERRDASTDPSWAAMQPLLPVMASSGQLVDAATAEGISACFACVQAISETVASLPLVLYQRADNGDRQRADAHPLYRVLHDRPNDHQTALEFREQMQASVLLKGNAYALIEWDGAGNVIGLHPRQANHVTVLRLGHGGIGYDIADHTGAVRRYTVDEVLHLKDRTENGIIGRSRIQIARDTLGLALSQQDHGNRTFANGARLSGVLQTPHQMTAESIQRLATSWRDQFAGTGNAGKTAILENGLSYQQIAMSLEDAQWIAAQQFSVEQICRIFRVPPTMVGDLKNANYSNAREMGAQFVRFTLARHLQMWEQAIEQRLLGPIARRRYYAEHNVEGLLRGDSEQRAQFYAAGITAGWLLPSEARRMENLPTVEGIDQRPRQEPPANAA